MSSRVFVTGAAGFIRSQNCQHLPKAGRRVAGFCDNAGIRQGKPSGEIAIRKKLPVSQAELPA